MNDAGAAAVAQQDAPPRHRAGRGQPLRLDLLERVTSRVDELLADTPVDNEETATSAWLAGAAELLAVAGEYDRARLLERRAIVRANLTAAAQEGLARDFHRDAVEAAELYERLGEPLAAATNFAAAAIAAVQAEQVGEALDIAVRALVAFGALPESEDDPVGEARMANMLGVLCYQFFDYERALQFYEIAARALTAPGQLPRWTAAAHTVAEVALMQARETPEHDPARRDLLLDRAEQLSRRVVCVGEPATFRSIDGPRLLASVLCERDRPEEAWPLLEAAAQAAGTPPTRGQIGGLLLARGRCLQLLGRPGEALIELDAALEVLDIDWDLAEYILALRLRAAVREESGDAAGALADMRRLADQVWARHQRQVGGFMDQVWGRAGVEGQRRDLEARAEDLIRTAEQDPLTGLANRRAVERFCAAMPLPDQVCLVLVDVDHFKEVNDAHGHPVGDAVLREVADVLSRSVRAVDRVARWGGEEFLLALPGASGELGAEAAARVRRRVQDHDWHAVAPGLRLTVSAGVACGPAGDLEAVLERADEAMYAAKRGGRNRVVSG